ncbi:molybdenum cofactor biosysynthesis protein [Streptomyces sp. NBC_01763]|nr:molybdenum cofactor biosysynthesis protein [Streptomyces sp. NBC_01763]
MSPPNAPSDEVEVVQLLVSPVHRYSGRPAEGPSADPVGGLVQQAEVRRHLGVVGDRYFAQAAHHDASVTVMAAESLPLDINPDVDLRQMRRNILLRGIDIDAYIGWTVELDSGGGPLILAVNRAARPCAWMDTVIGAGAQRALRGKGGVRCTPLSDGVLRVGRASFCVVEQSISRVNKVAGPYS